jgi:cell division protein FtsN
MARKPKTTRAAAKPAEETPVGAMLAEEAAVPDEAEVFEFAEGDEALPWLEGDDDEDEGPDTARLVGFALIGLILLAAIVGGIWYASRDRTDPELLADGSVIEAPTEPFKERPEDPGGKVHEGTGDTSFAVAEGQTRESRVDDAPVVRPSIDREQAPKPTTPPAPKPDRAATGGVGVQVAAYSDRASAEKGWAQLTRQYSALSGFKHRVVEGKADIGTVYRLQAVAANVSAANELCSTLRRAGAACQVKN